MEATRDPVGTLVELAARVELGHDDFGRVDVGHGGMGTDGDSAPVVHHRYGFVDVDGDVDL